MRCERTDLRPPPLTGEAKHPMTASLNLQTPPRSNAPPQQQPSTARKPQPTNQREPKMGAQWKW